MLRSVRVCDCCSKPVGINYYKLSLPNAKNSNRTETIDACEECNNKIALLLSCASSVGIDANGDINITFGK